MGNHYKKNKKTIMLIGGILLLALAIIFLIMYSIDANNKKNLETKDDIQISEANDEDDEYESVSLDLGKSVNDAVNEIQSETKNENVINNTTTNAKTSTKSQEKNETEKSETNQTEEDTSKVEEVKFQAPIKGEILREFAPDSLVYSKTLDEWIVHNGVDIKADKTTVVIASAKGTVESIKNDPRYGLTVIVEHDGGYKTLYANLLTAEFVVEGEEIEEGQTIGTVGNSANFEIADDYHLHFELIQNGVYINPLNYMNF